MPSAKQSEARSKVSLDSSSFEAGAKKVISAANAMSAALTTAMAAAGVALLAAFGAQSVKAVVGSMEAVLELGEETANAGRKAGLAAGQFYLFHKAMEKGISLKTAAGLIGENAEALNRSANTFRDVSIKLWAIGERIRGFWLGLMERVSPVLSRLLDGALAVQLVNAGNAFGETLANAVAVVYQLAKDGKLWDTLKAGFKVAFDYAGERLLWMGRVGFEVIKATFSEGIADGIRDAIKSVWTAIEDFANNFGSVIGNVFLRFFARAAELGNWLLNKFDSFLEWIGATEKGTAETMANFRAEELDKFRENAGLKPVPEAPDGSKFMEKIADIFRKNQFEPSADLSKQITEFSKTLGGALTQYKRDEITTPTTTFENNSRRAVTGVDSLAAIGAGGNVYLGLSMLDIQRSQLNELREINRKLDRSNPTTHNNFSFAAPTVPGISRAQTGSVISK